MGQYYKIINITKKEYLTPWRFDDGAKLVEFGNSGKGTMLALAALLSNGNGRGGGDIQSANSLIGSWAGDKIVIGGDYADADFLTKEQKKVVKKVSGSGDINLYNALEIEELGFIDISDKIIEVFKEAGESIRERDYKNIK